MSESNGAVVVEPHRPTGATATEAGRAEAPSESSSPYPQQKCPFLAGRPPHGSYHLRPSGVNVCYARGDGKKPYGHASKETQERCCLGGSEAYESCSDYLQAHSRAVTLPMFDGAGPSQHRLGHETPSRQAHRARVKHRRRHSWFRQWWTSSARTNFVCACWVLLALVSFWLVMRS